jgi:subtilisin family serine protease
VTSAVLVGVGAPVAGQTAERAPSPAQEQPDPQSGEASDSFTGYVGYVGADGAGASAAAPTDPDEPKTEPLGPIGTNSGESQDVPGQDAAADDSAIAAVPLPTEPLPAEVEKVEAELSAHGTAQVIVTMREATRLEADLSASQIGAQHAAIAESLDGLQATLEGTGSTKVHELQVVPSAVYEVTEDGLDALLADANVASVVLDGVAESQLDFSTGVIDSDLLNTAGVLGNGFEGGSGRLDVAIIDSGVDGGHNAFAGRIVRQACFVTDSSCPGGTNASTVAGSGEDCTHSTDCDHGTHVAGISAGGFYSGGHEGVARGAGIVAIKVAQDNPASSRWHAFFSSIDAGLQHVLNLKNSTNPNIVSVNISIGGNLSAAACDASLPTTAALVNNLAAAGVATVIAAGNDGSSTMVSFPGCVTNAVTVSAASNTDTPASFTNSNALTDFWAPGVGITAPIPTGTNEGPKSGTSMAAPHVAGAMALLRECVDGNGVPITNANAIGDLLATGVNVPRNGVTRKRINVLDAATSNVNNNDFASPEVLVGNGPVDDFDFNVCADSEAGEPGPFSVDNSVWWRWTAPATGTVTISTEDDVVPPTHATTFDTTLAVYTGNTLGSLVPVALDDDSGTGLRSLVVFPVQGGTTYRIKVDGFAATNGLLNLHLQNGPPPQCFGVPATIVGTINSDVINGTPGNDVIVAGDGNDTVNGNGGNDRICAGNGNDSVSGGTGTDFVLGDPGADLIRGDGDNDTLVGNAGGGDLNDLGDTIVGGPGNDFIDGWAGNDTLVGGPGNDTIRGAQDMDTVRYDAAPAGVTASLTTNTAAGGDGNDTYDIFGGPIENIFGSNFNDLLVGDAGNNVLRGLGGNDVLDGRAGNDVLGGGAGHDQLFGRLGNDIYVGEAGNDTASFVASPAAVSASLLVGAANGEGADTLNGVEHLTGSAFNDVLTGNAQGNLLQGLAGNDGMRGLGSHDLLLGGDGNDTALGGDGNDQLVGAAGNDHLVGEAGVDNHNGGAGRDVCNGGLGLDAQVLCEVIISIP